MKPLTPPRPKSRSSDDLEEVAALDAAESRATAALRLMNEERAAREAAEAELERLRQAEVQRQLDAVSRAAATPVKVEAAPDTKSIPSSMRPGILTVQAKGVKVGIPLALLTPALALGWAAYQNITDYVRQFKALTATVAGYEKRIEAQDKFIAETRAEQAKLRETQAAQAGYLTGVLPMAGVKVPGTATEVKADPLPANARRQTPVNVRTPVPTPPAK